MDILEIDGASNRGIDEIRNLRDNVKFKPANARFKIYIIDEVHMLTTPAFNALLKTLEEPPQHAIFILATTEPHKILPTILSRCQRFDFKKLTISEIVALLLAIAKKEKFKIAEDALKLIAVVSEGDLRDATSILDQVISISKKNTKKTTLQDVQKLLGIGDLQALVKLVDLIIKLSTIYSQIFATCIIKRYPK